jgi:lipoprotein-anchoring transpeptidase ErfK/SrfK
VSGARRCLVGLAVACVGASVRAQIPPRRIVPTPADTATAGRTPRSADLADGTAVPRNARSLRIERDGEVIRRAPDGNAPRRGTAARGARLPALEATQGPGCRSVWVRVEADAWVCGDDAPWSTEAPAGDALPRVPDGDVVPFQYAFATHAGVRTYRRLDDVAEDNWAEELERGMSVAVTGTDRTLGATYVRTASGRWVAMRDLAWARPSERAGIFYDTGAATEGVGFLRANTRAWPDAETALRGNAPARSTTALAHRDGVQIREERTLRGRRLVRVDAGWLPAAALLRPTTAPFPADLAPGERWVDIDRANQTLVAYEGRAPVFAALVSTGRAAAQTQAGEHRVWVKLAMTDMSNVNDTTLESATALYTVARVPWVMFFHRDQALHAAFWHDSFGRARSHGCVNLAPRDARWLYDWAPPRLPPGWTGAFPTPAEPGMRVRVR